MAREDLHFRLRIPEDLKKQIEAAAISNEQSMTAEMVARLQQSFDNPVSIPDALMGRIAAYARRQGRTANEEINRLLEREYPEQWDVDQRMEYLADMLAILRGGRSDSRIDHFIAEVKDTVEGALTGRLKGISAEARADMHSLWERFQERELEDSYYESPEYEWDEEERRSAAITQHPEKLAEPLPNPRQPLRDNVHLMNILPAASLSALTEKLSSCDLEGAAEVVRNMPKEEIEKLIAFDNLPEWEKHRLRGETPPPSGKDPFDVE